MLIADLDELTYDAEEDGVLVRRQLERVVVAQGPWATVMFLFQELDRATGAYRAPKIALVRFQKWRGGYRKQSALTLASAAQARQIGAVLAAWDGRLEPDAAEDDAGAGT